MDKRRNNLCMLAVLAAMLCGQLACGQEVRLRPQAACTSAMAVLGDVAEMQGLPESVGQIPMARLEQAGSKVTVTIFQLQSALRQAGVNTACVNFSGAARCTICRAAEPPVQEAQNLAAEPPRAGGDTEKGVDGVVKSDVDSADAAEKPEAHSKAAALKAGPPGQAEAGAAPAKAAGATVGRRIQEQLLEQLAARPEELSLCFAPASQQTAEMALCTPVSITSTDQNVLGRRTWRVDYEQNGRMCQRYVTGTIRLMRPAVVARRALAPGTSITASDVQLVMREDDGRQERLDRLESAVGQQVRRALLEGQIIGAGDLKSPVLVVRGQLAWVLAGFVQVRAKALGQGAQGELVEFENVQSKGHVWAQVTGPGTAQVTCTAAAK